MKKFQHWDCISSLVYKGFSYIQGSVLTDFIVFSSGTKLKVRSSVYMGIWL